MISIVICSCNREKYLPVAIESVISQTYEDFELILWDDGSVDKSPQICKFYEQIDNRITVHLSPINQGFYPSLKQAIACTSGEYVGWVDSDDWIRNTCLEKTHDILESHKDIGFVYTHYYDVNEQGEILKLGERCKYSPQFLLFGFVTFHFRLIRRSVFDAVGGINNDYPIAGDYDLCLRLAEADKIYELKEPLYYYRQHDENMSKIKRKEQMLYSSKAIQEAVDRRLHFKI